jgi:hypothetical protein
MLNRWETTMSATSMRLQRKPASDVIYSAFSGLAIMTAIGGVEGFATGGLFGLAEGLERGVRPTMFVQGGVGGMICAMIIGAPIGFVCWGLLEVLCRRIPDEAVLRAQRAAMKGSVFGVSLGGLLGLFLAPMMPGHVEAGQGYICGVIAGFIGGTLLGGINRAWMEACDYEEPEEPSPRNTTTDDRSLHVDVTEDFDQLRIRLLSPGPTQVDLLITDGERGGALPCTAVPVPAGSIAVARESSEDGG